MPNQQTLQLVDRCVLCGDLVGKENGERNYLDLHFFDAPRPAHKTCAEQESLRILELIDHKEEAQR